METQATLQNAIDLINKAMVNTQNLQLMPTEHNVTLIAESLKALRGVAEIVGELYGKIEAMKNEDQKDQGELKLIIGNDDPQSAEANDIEIKAEAREKV